MAESDEQKNIWNEQNVPYGAFGNMLERMTNQFTPNHGSQHYQSGFIPATTPAWTAHPHNQIPMTYVQQHDQTHNIGIDPSLSLNSPRSFSVSQDPYPEMTGNRTPLLRSSSDLGIRMATYPSQHSSFSELDGIIDQQVEETMDNPVFYSDGSHLPQTRPNPNNISGVPSYQHIQTSNAEILRTQPAMHYGSYSQDNNTLQDGSENNLSTKLSNFRASLGTWFSPLPVEQSQNNFVGNSENVDTISNHRTAAIDDTSSLETLRTGGKIAPAASKMSYSDVLSKAPSQECKGNSVSSAPSNKSFTFHSPNSHQKNREPSLRTGGKSKGRNNNISGRSNSPITNLSSSSNMNKHSNAGTSKIETTSFSKVGLDDFDLPENSSTRYSCSYMNNLNNNSKSCNVESFDTSKKRSSLTSEDSSPAHQPKKGTNRNEKKMAEKVEDSPVSSDIEKSQCDKLNNHTLSSQPKQTPKRTTYINNDLASPSSGNKTNNSESSQYSLNRKNNTSKEDFKLQNKYDDVSLPGINKSPSQTSSNLSGSFPNYPNNRTQKRFSAGRTDKKDNLTKKTYGKKKKEIPSSYHSELMMTGWMMCKLWIGMAAKAGLWLLQLVLDIVQMSWRLSVDYGLHLFANGKLQWHDIKLYVYGYYAKIFSFFWRSKTDSNKKTGRGDRKSASGLETKIPLPTTGDEAMKRLLACRGKDPYNILGVTHECSDDDIKRYYKRQAFLVHPDKNKQPGAEEAFKILAHAFEIIGEPGKREKYDTKLAEEVHFEGAWGELTRLLNSLKQKLEEAANTIRCTNCNKRHKRVKLPRPTYAARHCAECQIKHAAKEGDIWAESCLMGLRWKYYACMEGAIYDISEWAACQRDNLKHLQANTHSVQYRIVSGKKNAGGKPNAPECPTDPELEEFFNSLCRERFGKDFVSGGNPSANTSSDAKKRKGKKKK